MHSEESPFEFSIRSNLNNFPLKINKTNQVLKTPFSLKFNKWNLSPSTALFFRNKSTPSLYKNLGNILFVRVKYKF